MASRLGSPILAVLAAVVAIPAAAASKDAVPGRAAEPEVVAQEGGRHGGWGAPVVQATTVRKAAAVLVGGRGGWLIDRRVTIGGGGYALVTPVEAPPTATRPAGTDELRMGYGGLWLEYTFAPIEILHVSVGSLVGGGTVAITRRATTDILDRDGFFALEPTTTVELNLTRFVRVDVGVAYRWILGEQMEGLPDSDVSGFGLLAAVKFGKF
jgi:hypothetical protein